MNEMNQPDQLTLKPKKSPIKLVISIIIVLLVGIGLYVYFTPTEKLPEFIAKPIAKEIPAVNVILAASIDNDFNYAAQPNKEYLEGSPLFAYVEIRDFAQNANFAVDISEDIEIKDSQNNIMFAQSKFAELKESYGKKMAVLLLDNGIKTTGWKPGNYVLNLRINDNLAKKSTMKSADFVIKKVPSNQFISTIDLSGIITGSDSSSDLTRTQVVRDSNGKAIQELNITQPVTGDLLNLNLKFVDASFQMPERFEAGTYSVRISYTNIKTGKSAFVEGNAVLDKKFAVSDFVFASRINDDYSFDVQPNKEYKKGDNVYIYSKLVNFMQKPVSGGFNVNFTESLEIMDSDGVVFLSEPNYLNINSRNTLKLDAYDINTAFSALDLLADNYTVRVTITDLNSGQKAVREGDFLVT